jgi:hypothetical protein
MQAKDGPDGRTRLDVAKQQAKDIIDAMPRGGTAMVIAFDDDAKPVQPFTSDQNLLKQAVDRIQATDRRSDIKLAYQLADAQVNFNPEQLRDNKEPPDIRVFTDGRLINVEEAGVKGNVTYHKIGNPAAGNVAVVALSAKRNYERPTQVQVFARLANFGPDPVDAPVRLSIDGEAVTADNARAEDLLLLPDRWTEQQRQEWETKSGKKSRDSVDFRLDLTRAAVVRLEHTNKKTDVLAVDDVAQVVVPPPKALSVLLVTDGNLFVQRAVQALNVKTKDVTQPADYEAKKPTTYDVIIFDNYKPTFCRTPGTSSGSTRSRTGSRRRSRPTRRPVPRGHGRQPGHARGRSGAGLEARAPDPAEPRDRQLVRRAGAEAERAAGPGGAAGRAEGPADRARPTGKATHLVVAFDVMNTNWVIKPSFPIFFHQAMQYLAVGQAMDVRQTLRPGEVVRVPRSNLQQVGTDLKRVTLGGPGGKKELPVPDAGEFVLPVMEKVGLYTTDPPVPGYEQMAVNVLDATESNLLPADKLPAAAPQAGGNEGETTGKRRLELWWWLALVALGVLTIEWWVYTRRVHL